MFAILGSSVGKMIFPYSSEVFASGKKGELKEIISQLQRTLLFMITPVAIIFFMFSEDFLSLFFGHQFREGSGVVRLLVAGALIHTLTIINVNTLNGIGHPLKVTKLVILNSSINLGGNILFIPVWGMEGAAISTLIAYWIMFWGSSRYIKSLVGHSFKWGLLARVLLSSLSMVIILIGGQIFITDNFWILFIIFLPLSFTLYLLASFVFGLISREEFARINSKIKEIISSKAAKIKVI